LPSHTSYNGALSPREKALTDVGNFLVREKYFFTTVTPSTHSRVTKQHTFQRAKDLRGIFGWSLPFDQALLPAGIIDLMRGADVLRTLQNGNFQSSVRYSTLDNAIFVHSAYPTIQSDAVFFGPDTVRFVAIIISHLERRLERACRVVDIGCGAGPGGIAIARRCPNAVVQLLDINDEALSASRINAAINEASNAVAVKSDVLAAVRGSFDLIVANPPYLVDPAQRAYRHGGGNFGEGMSVRILKEALPRLSEGGTMLPQRVPRQHLCPRFEVVI
jgi:hypothetical protein